MKYITVVWVTSGLKDDLSFHVRKQPGRENKNNKTYIYMLPIFFPVPYNFPHAAITYAPKQTDKLQSMLLQPARQSPSKVNLICESKRGWKIKFHTKVIAASKTERNAGF